MKFIQFLKKIHFFRNWNEDEFIIFKTVFSKIGIKETSFLLSFKFDNSSKKIDVSIPEAPPISKRIVFAIRLKVLLSNLKSSISKIFFTELIPFRIAVPWSPSPTLKSNSFKYFSFVKYVLLQL